MGWALMAWGELQSSSSLPRRTGPKSHRKRDTQSSSFKSADRKKMQKLGQEHFHSLNEWRSGWMQLRAGPKPVGDLDDASVRPGEIR